MKISPALLLATALAGCAHARPDADAPASLAAAERAFASAGSSGLVHDAFVAVLDTDGVLFRPLPVNGLEALKARPMRPTLLLRWTPIIAETSADGTLGMTTGPSEYGTRGEPVAGTGYFVSVWRRTGGVWKLMLDGGIDSPIPQPVDSAMRLLVTRTNRPASVRPQDANEYTGPLSSVENALAAGYANVAGALVDERTRVYRDGHAPTTTRDAGLALMRADAAVRWQPRDVITAATGDFGYAYGVTNPGAEKPGGYARIYHRDGKGQWRLAIDWRN